MLLKRHIDWEYSSEDKGPIFKLNVRNQSILDVLKQYENMYKDSLGEDYFDYREEIEHKHRK